MSSAIYCPTCGQRLPVPLVPTPRIAKHVYWAKHLPTGKVFERSIEIDRFSSLFTMAQYIEKWNREQPGTWVYWEG